jgi:cobalt-zinc-cadmium efflux system outer membrane protein
MPRLLAGFSFGVALLVLPGPLPAQGTERAPAQRPLQTQSDEGASLSLSEAIRLAARYAPQAAEADAALRVADSAVDIARLRPNPTLSVEAENIAGSGAYAGGAERETTAALSFPIELGGKRAARVRVAQAERGEAAVTAGAASAETVLLTTEAFLAVTASERRLELARERLQLAEAALNAARLRVKAGKASPIEEQRAEVVRVSANVQADRAERLAGLARSQLARLTGVAPDVAIAAPWFATTDTGETAGVGSVAAPALAVADARIAAAEARVDLAQRSRVPDITLSAGFRQAAEPGDTAAIVGVAVPLPLFDTGRAEVTRARAELELAQARKHVVAQEFEQALATARVEVANAQAAAKASGGPALEAAREAARIARIGYAAGKFSQLELIEAERVLSETHEAAIDALVALHAARARLGRLEGRADPIFEN